MSKMPYNYGLSTTPRDRVRARYPKAEARGRRGYGWKIYEVPPPKKPTDEPVAVRTVLGHGHNVMEAWADAASKL